MVGYKAVQYMDTDYNSRDYVTFYFGGELVVLDDVSTTDMVLPWLRYNALMTGTKEGCNEGDCGACTCIVGRLSEAGEFDFSLINACIFPLVYLDGSWLISVDSLSHNGSISSAQFEVMSKNGSQCGFCTPGFVMAITYAQINGGNDSPEQVLSGNLCRCTGYGGLIEATRNCKHLPLDAAFVLAMQRARDALTGISQGGFVIERDGSRVDAPKSLTKLLCLRAENPSATLVGGSTDFGLWVTKKLENPSHIILTRFCHDLLAIKQCEDIIEIGAAVSIEHIGRVLVSEYPELKEWHQRFGGPQVRCSGTIGGNIANGSPIGDSSPVLIALGASLKLRSVSGERVIPIESFFIEYGKQDLKADEIVESVIIPKRDKFVRVRVEKISKRFDQDISIVLVAMVELSKSKSRYRFAFGGMAGIPKLAKKTMQTLNPEHLEVDFSPLSDHRADSWYRLNVSKNLVRDFVEGRISNE